jgi:alginate O-acetyltransferase complex protein AlgI
VSAYLPRDYGTLGLVGLVLAGILILGFVTTRVRSVAVARAAAWLLAGAGTALVERLCAHEPPGVRMVAIILALLWGLKAVVSVEAQAAGQPRLTPLRWFSFAALWLGMRPAAFATAGGPVRQGAGRLIGKGLAALLLGAGFIGLARLVWARCPSSVPASGVRILATALLLVGLSLVLHFGLCNLLAGAWRLAGAECRSLFRSPLGSSSLTEFWGRRWNLAFSEMTAVAVYRPMVRWLGQAPATFAAFLFSGLLHELAISVPVAAGYGLPLLYFTLHGLLVLGERGLARAGRPVDRPAWLGRLWTLGWLVLPLPLLFHPPFLRGVVWPLIGMGD